LYLEALRADRAVVAAQANVELAQALLQLAQDQRNAGVATGVDVTRAQTRLAEQQVGLAQAQTESEQARLNLQRLIGLPLGSPLTLTDKLRFVDEPSPAVDTAVGQAAQDRREIQVAKKRTESVNSSFNLRARNICRRWKSSVTTAPVVSLLIVSIYRHVE